MSLSDSAATTEIIEQHVDRAAWLTINRPDKHNALTLEGLAQLSAAIERARTDVDTRVIVLSGAGSRSFCTGADLSTINAGDPTEAHDARGALAEIFGQLWACGLPTIARVDGYALAGGFGLALACDYTVCSDRSTFGTPEIDRGLWPYMITIPMLRAITPRVALDLMQTGRRLDADEALRIGAVSRIAAPEALDDEVSALVSCLADKPATALRLGRTAFYKVVDELEQTLPYLHASLTVGAQTHDAAVGIAEFLGRSGRGEQR